MGQRTKGGKWCDTCRKPVLGIKTTARARNTVSALTAPGTMGASLLFAKMEGYVCPTCGQPVRRATQADLARHAEEQGGGLTPAETPPATTEAAHPTTSEAPLLPEGFARATVEGTSKAAGANREGGTGQGPSSRAGRAERVGGAGQGPDASGPVGRAFFGAARVMRRPCGFHAQPARSRAS